MSKATLTLAREALLPALALVGRTVERRNTIPILSNVLLCAEDGTLTLTATDLDIEMTAACACTGDDAATTLPAASLHDIVRKLPEGCELKLAGDERAWSISSGRSRFSLQCLPVTDMPVMSPANFTHVFTLPAATLASLFDTVRHAISTEETRFYLNGIYLHADESAGEPCLLAVTTDGHRLARFPAHLPEGAAGLQGVIVPRKTVDLMAKMLPAKGDVTLSVSDTRIRLTLEDGATLVSKLVDGTYPDYRRVMPQGNANRFLVDRAALFAAIDRVTTISAQRGSAVKFGFGDGELKLSAANPNAGDAEELVDIEKIAGGPVETGFNGRYALDMLNAVEAENVQFEIGDAGSPALVRPHDGDDGQPSFVLMPMRV